ncbi:MAG: hypothetical protein M5U31_14600 [Acidimicrobiia bacterium]|nr:hypothetical protein [Acidimicrobiia bacterium]
MADGQRRVRRKRRGLLVSAAAGITLVGAACLPPPPPPPPPPAVCTSGAPETDVLTHAGGADQDAAEVPVIAVTEDANGDLDVVTYGAEDLGDASEFADDLEADPATDVVAVEADQPVAVEATATDPKRPQQWAFNNVSFESAWNTANGAGTTIAVVDTGVRATHEDLASKMEAGADFVTPGGGTGCSGPPRSRDTRGGHRVGVHQQREGCRRRIAGFPHHAGARPRCQRFGMDFRRDRRDHLGDRSRSERDQPFARWRQLLVVDARGRSECGLRRGRRCGGVG